MSWSRVIVGLAGASANGPTLSWAVNEANRSGRRLLVCFACPPDSALAAPGAGTRIALLELAEPALARAVAAARLRLGGDRVAVLARPQPPEDLLVAVATSADLLVVGAPTRPGWLERRSTTHQVVRHAAGPVVVVRPTTPQSAAGGAHPTLAGHIVVGVDGSAPARAALEFAFAYAAEHRRPLAAVHVAPWVGDDMCFDDRLRELALATEPAVLPVLAEEVEPWQHKYPDVVVKRAVFGGRPLAGLLRASAGSALLCVGNSGSGLAGRLLGSVTHGAVDHARCPVGVVREGQGREGRGRGEGP